MGPLELLHRGLSDSYRMSSEREVLITALLEELEEIGDDLENAGEYSILEANISGRSIAGEIAEDLQAALKRNRSTCLKFFHSNLSGSNLPRFEAPRCTILGPPRR